MGYKQIALLFAIIIGFSVPAVGMKSHRGREQFRPRPRWHGLYVYPVGGSPGPRVPVHLRPGRGFPGPRLRDPYPERMQVIQPQAGAGMWIITNKTAESAYVTNEASASYIQPNQTIVLPGDRTKTLYFGSQHGGQWIPLEQFDIQSEARKIDVTGYTPDNKLIIEYSIK